LTRLKKLSPFAVTLSNSNKSMQPLKPLFLKLLIVLLSPFKIDRETIWHVPRFTTRPSQRSRQPSPHSPLGYRWSTTLFSRILPKSQVIPSFKTVNSALRAVYVGHPRDLSFTALFMAANH
jgi:hypothetical protein